MPGEMRRPLSLLALVLLGLVGGARGEVSVEASISANQVGVGEAFQLTVQVVNPDKVDNLPWPQVQNLETFSVTKTTTSSRSAQTTIINGRISQSNQFVTNFVYTLTAKKPGSFQIGPIRYARGNFERNLGSATVTVVKQEAGLTTVPSLSKKSVFLGEQLLYNLRIIPSQGVQQINLPQDLRKLIGEKFWFQQLDKNVEPKTVNLNGQPTRVFDIRIVLFPLLSGKVELSGIPVEYQQISRNQRRRNGSVFDMFDEDFFGGGAVVNMSAMANPVSLVIDPLPPGSPPGFTGSVGEYTLTAATDKTTLPSGDAVALTVTIRGDGQPKTITKPLLPDLTPFEVFDPEVTTASAVSGSNLITTKTFKYVMVPRRQGDYTIGPVGFSYFQPARREYAEVQSRPITLTVTPGKESAAAPGRVLSQREITDIGSDIRHIKIDASPLGNEDNFLYKHVWFWLLFPPAPLAFALILVMRRRNLRMASDTTLKRKTQAGAHLRRRLKEAGEALKQKNAREFYKALSQAVVGFVSDKLNVEFRGLPMEDAKARLRERGLAEASVKEYEDLLQQCDFGQFAGAQRDEKAWRDALDTAETMLKKLDREL